ncbi:hypothetical protein OIU79_001819, partial [Salix purpurea]
MGMHGRWSAPFFFIA